MKRYNIYGIISHLFFSSNEKQKIIFNPRLKDNTSLTDTISSQGRIRTFTDGVLSIQNIQPSDHGLYICIVSIINSTRIRSKPAIITVKCKFIGIDLEKYEYVIRSTNTIEQSSA